MAGAYLTFNPSTCQVYLSRVPIQGSSQWYPGLPSQTGTTVFGAYAFTQQYPGYLTLPYHCIPAAQQPQPPQFPPPPPPPPPPAGSGDPPPAEVPGPITGDPPPAECGAGIPVPIESDPVTGPVTGSWWQSGDTGPGGTDGQGTLDQLAQPLVLGMTPLPTYSSDKPVYKQEAYFSIRTGEDRAIADAYHEGTGPGMVVFHPPELQDFMLHGTTAQYPRSKWPTNVSASSVMLHNSTRDDGSTGDDAVTYLAFGIPLKGTVKPGSGHYFTLDQSDYQLILRTTGTTGADNDNGTFTLDQMALNLGQQTTAGLGLYTGAQAGALIWDTTVGGIKYYDGTVWLPISGSGSLARVYGNTAQNLTNATWTKVQNNQESFDTGACYDSTTNYRYTPTVAGYYQVNWNVEFALWDSEAELHPWWDTRYGVAFKSAIYKNGSKYAGGSTDSNKGLNETEPDETVWPESHGSDIVYLNGSTDYIELWAWGYSLPASTYTPRIRPGTTQTYMSVTRLDTVGVG